MTKKKQTNEFETKFFADERIALIKRGYRRRRRFLIHLFIFLGWLVIWAYMSSIPSFSMWVNFQNRGFVATSIWFVVLGFHFIYQHTWNAEDEALLDIMGESGEKRKMHYEEEYVQQRPDMTEEYRLRLGDDGELVHGEMTDEEIAYYEQMQRNQHK